VVSSLRTDFNYDFDVSLPEDIEHTRLSSFALEMLETNGCAAAGVRSMRT
jgi:hypothetical protein